MIRDILTNRWILGGIGFLILIAGGCFFWYEYTTSQYEKAAAETEAFARQWEKNQKAKPKATTVEQATDVTAAESETPPADKLRNNVTPVTDKTEPSPAGNPAQNAETEDVQVSPNGFGPYPEIPAEMGIPADKVKVVWESLSVNPRHELSFRVRVKLYQQGIKATGATYLRNGLIYPIIKGVRYVEFDELEYPDGTVKRYVSRSTGHPDDNFMRGVKGPVLESDIPVHLKIYTYPDGGIDPYQFLNLPKE